MIVLPRDMDGLDLALGEYQRDALGLHGLQEIPGPRGRQASKQVRGIPAGERLAMSHNRCMSPGTVTSASMNFLDAGRAARRYF